MRNANLPEFFGTRPNSVKSQTTASMRSGHGKGEYAPRGALCVGAGQMGSNDLPPYAPSPSGGKPVTKVQVGTGAQPARRPGTDTRRAPRPCERTPARPPATRTPHTGRPTQGAVFPTTPSHRHPLSPTAPVVTHVTHATHANASGTSSRSRSRSTDYVLCSCADDDGSAVVGSGDDGSALGVGSSVVCVGLGSPFEGSGCSPPPAGPPAPPVPPLPSFDVALADGFARPDADASGKAEPDTDFPGLGDPPCAPRPPGNPPCPPLPAALPSGASPPCRPAECDAPGLAPSSPTLMQPAAATMAMTVATRRTGTYKARTGSHLRRRDREVPLPNSQRPQEDTRALRPDGTGEATRTREADAPDRAYTRTRTRRRKPGRTRTRPGRGKPNLTRTPAHAAARRRSRSDGRSRAPPSPRSPRPRPPASRTSAASAPGRS